MAGARELQLAFAAHLRDPARNPAPAGVEERRLQVYRDLVYNNVESFLAGFFPVLRSLYADADWHALVRAFLAAHRAQTPYFLEISEEFLRFLDGHADRPCDPPFLRALAHWEWLELAVDVAAEDFPAGGCNPGGDLLAGIPFLSPLAVLGAYDWPVHRISADFRPQQPLPAPVCLVVYRDRADQVRFLEVSAATARLFGLMRERPLASGRELAQALGAELGHADPATLLAGAGELLAGLRARDIVLGTRLADTAGLS